MTNFLGFSIIRHLSLWRAFRGLSEKGEIDERHDSQPEQERVGLKIPDLNQTQKRADSESAAACSADNPTINNPAIEESGHARQEFLRSVDQPFVKFVEVKAPLDKIDMQRISLAVSIKPNGKANA